MTFRVENTGSRPGWAVPQLYLHRTQGVVTARRRQLCGFDKQYLAPGEKVTVTIPIPRESLGQWNTAMDFLLPPGRIQWFLEDSNEPLLEGSFYWEEQV